MDETISTLRIEIGASTDNARKEIDKVADSLKRLKSSSQNGQTAHKIRVDAKDVDKAKEKVGALANILNSLKRIAFYRVIRSAIKAIGETFKEGAEDAYWYSRIMGDQTKYIADAYDLLATKSLTMTNQLGASWATLKAAITPVLIEIVQWITKVADAITQLFALLGGKSTYLKAIDYSKEWADATKGGAKAAKEWRNQILGFDEINRLEAPNQGSGGGTSKIPEGVENMFTESPVDSGIGKWFAELKKITTDWIDSINFQPLYDSWARLTAAVMDFISLCDGGLKWVYVNILLPLGKWTLEKGAPAAIELFASAFELLNSIIRTLAPYFYNFYLNVIKPFANFIGEKLLGAMEELTATFESLASKVEKANSVKEFIDSLDGKEKIFVALTAAVAAFALGTLALSVATTVIKGLASAIALVTSPAGLATIALTGLILVGMKLYSQFESVREKFDAVGEKFSEFKDRFQEPEYWAELGTTIVEAVSTAIGAAIGMAFDAVKGIFDKDSDGKATLKEIGEAIMQGIYDGIEFVLVTFGGWVIDHVFKPFVQGFKDAFGIHSPSEEMKPIGENIWNGVCEGIISAIVGVGAWIVENIWTPFKSGIMAIFGIDEANANMSGFGTNIITGLKNGITNALDGIGAWIVDSIWTPLCEGFNTIIDNINAWWQGVVSFVDSAVTQINEFIARMDARAIQIEADGSIYLQGFASGGFPEDGLFMANHGELVGQFANGRTAVANNEQITEGIREAVFDAFVSAMSMNGSNGQPIEIYLDGNEIAKSTTRYQRQYARAGGV